MKKDLTEIVFILDKSGSMSGFEADTIGGFNSLIKKQKELEGEALVSLVLFNNNSEVVYDRVPLKQVEQLTARQYYPSGCTALLDAVGDAIHHIGNIHKYARNEDVPEKTLFVITTDGLENASHRYSYGQIKELIKKETEKHGWDFLFLGANINALDIAEDMGIDPLHASNYKQDNLGIELTFKSFDAAVTSVRQNRRIDPNWCEETATYYEKNSKKH